jgi:sodium pump decarboxylase gamma subunit
MTISTMFGQSFVVMLLGVAVVFSFLAILIGAITASSKALHALGLDKEEPPKAAATSVVATNVAPDAGHIAAITAAVKIYRNE